MSLHIEAKKGEIAPDVLLPGDPLRAKYMAEKFLDNAKCYNQVRGMYGYTGTYKGKRVSIQGSGMGIPSMAIYFTELVQDYGLKRCIRVGSCGATTEELALGDIFLALSASSDSGLVSEEAPLLNFAPTANSKLLTRCMNLASGKKLDVRCGNVFSTDRFYQEGEYWKQLAEYEIFAVEMESAGLYTLAAKYGVEALTLLTVSDMIPTKKVLSSEEREKSFIPMMELALDTLLS